MNRHGAVPRGLEDDATRVGPQLLDAFSTGISNSYVSSSACQLMALDAHRDDHRYLVVFVHTRKHARTTKPGAGPGSARTKRYRGHSFCGDVYSCIFLSQYALTSSLDACGLAACTFAKQSFISACLSA